VNPTRSSIPAQVLRCGSGRAQYLAARNHHGIAPDAVEVRERYVTDVTPEGTTAPDTNDRDAAFLRIDQDILYLAESLARLDRDDGHASQAP
jgi:hypothetical protein